MLQTTFKSAIILFLLTVSVQSFGQKEPSVWVKSGTMHFRDTAAFNKTRRTITGYTESELNKWEEKQGFTSNRTLVNRAIGEFKPGMNNDQVKQLLKKHKSLLYFNPADSSVTGIVDDAFYSAICDKNGIFYVGKSVHRIKNNYEITVENGNLETLNSATESLKSDPAKGATVANYKSGVSMTLASTCSAMSYPVTVTKNTLRCQAWVYILNSSPYQLWVESKSQQKIGFVWVAYTTVHNFQLTNVTVTYNGGTFNSGAHFTTQTTKVVSKYYYMYLPYNSNPTITAINFKVQTQGIYPLWLQINCQ